MPDLSHKAVHQFWHSYDDPTLYKVICMMEAVEDWTQDGDPALEKALLTLADALDRTEGQPLEDFESVIELVTFIKTGRGLRVLMALDVAHPGLASKILMHGESITQSSSDTAGLMLRRNVVFERLRLLGRIFSAERTQMVTAALEDGHFDD